MTARPGSSGFVTNLYGTSGTFTIGPNVIVRTGTYAGGSGAIVLGDGVTG